MARVEVVIRVVCLISGFILKNSPFPSSCFFPEKKLLIKNNDKKVSMSTHNKLDEELIEQLVQSG